MPLTGWPMVGIVSASLGWNYAPLKAGNYAFSELRRVLAV